LRVANTDSRFTRAYAGRQVARMTIGHGEGNYHADDATLDRLEGEGRVAFTYAHNPNGSQRDIAGILNEGGNVLGLMPHPDRAFESELGSADGARVFESLLAG
jgi:phosphoribosylformylglycinamidine synthase subunit PurQ / glutaminase